MIQFSLDWVLVIQLLVSTILPILVGLVTKTVTSGAKKAVLLAILSLASSLLFEIGQALTEHTVYDLGRGLLLALPTFFVAVAMHYGLWKPTGVSETAQSLFIKGKTITVQESPVRSTVAPSVSDEHYADPRSGTSGRS